MLKKIHLEREIDQFRRWRGTIMHRCPWAGNDPLYIDYHDREWGAPVHDDRLLFEFLILEGVQAGLSWITILRKRENYRKAYFHFDPERIAGMTESDKEILMANPGIIRNRRKIEAAVANAAAFLKVREEYGSFDSYLWQFVGGTPKVNHWQTSAEVPAVTPESEAMSKDLRRRGFQFVGPTICYGYMQAVGMVNDHLTDCFRHDQLLP